MPEEFEIDRELANLESQIGNWTPHSESDHDAVLYRAGWEAAMAHASEHHAMRRPSPSHWVAGALGAVAATLALLILRPADLAEGPRSSPISTAETSSEREGEPASTPNGPIDQEQPARVVPAEHQRVVPASRNSHLASMSRRDPEQWLRETDRLSVKSDVHAPIESHTSIRTLYRALSDTHGDTL